MRKQFIERSDQRLKVNFVFIPLTIIILHRLLIHPASAQCQKLHCLMNLHILILSFDSIKNYKNGVLLKLRILSIALSEYDIYLRMMNLKIKIYKYLNFFDY